MVCVDGIRVGPKKRKGILPLATTGVELGGITLGEASQGKRRARNSRTCGFSETEQTDKQQRQTQKYKHHSGGLRGQGTGEGKGQEAAQEVQASSAAVSHGNTR